MPIIRNLLLLLMFGAAAIGCKKDNKGYVHNNGQAVTISAVSPGTGPIGTEILIKGSNFSGDTAGVSVTINGVPLLVVGVNGNEIMAVVTQKTGTGPIVVKVGKDAGTSTDPFNYLFSYTVNTLAGSGSGGYNDGKGTGASFNFNG